MRISVVGTVHEEMGAATASALLVILQRIRPKVIFLEMPASAAAEYFNGSRSNLESNAVSQYRDLCDVELVPVDLPTPEPEFFRSIQALDRELQCKDYQCFHLARQDKQHIETYGFAYLNSVDSQALGFELHAARLAALDRMANRGFTNTYEEWVATNERRDEAMLRNIASYGRHTSLRVGAFLVGAAHRASIIEKSGTHAGSSASSLQWDFDGFL